ncbi:MAG TPA: hypothetical protein VEK07_07095 [Polyangiaceae bacterium]|nr:hypothetical protein [Polyangiaceae bacterium]
MPFAYYRKLSAKQKATYRKSDEISILPVPDVEALRTHVRQLEAALASGQRLVTAKAASALVSALCRQLGAPPVKVTVRMVRPQIRGGELHGLYRLADEGKDPTIDLWMRTVAHERIVRFRTFLRTLLHEVAHHLDVTLLGLDESFHTGGFFRRESSLVRQLVTRPSSAKKEMAQRKPAQLALF